MTRDIKIAASTLADLVQDDERRAPRETLPMLHGLSDAEKTAWLEVDDFLRRNPHRSERFACGALGVTWALYLRAREKAVASNTEALGGAAGTRNERETK